MLVICCILIIFASDSDLVNHLPLVIQLHFYFQNISFNAEILIVLIAFANIQIESKRGIQVGVSCI